VVVAKAVSPRLIFAIEAVKAVLLLEKALKVKADSVQS
jgi:hypothetical protein